MTTMAAAAILVMGLFMRVLLRLGSTGTLRVCRASARALSIPECTRWSSLELALSLRDFMDWSVFLSVFMVILPGV